MMIETQHEQNYYKSRLLIHSCGSDSPLLIRAFLGCLCDLSSDRAGHSDVGMDVSKEPRWISLNPGNLEACTSIYSIRQDTGLEWALQTADTDPLTADGLWVGKRDSWWTEDGSTMTGQADR